MAKKKSETLSRENQTEIAELRRRLDESEELLRAIREGEVDAIIVKGSRGEQIFSLSGAESVYRIIVETMSEAAVTLSTEGRILFCNRRFSQFVGTPSEQIIGRLLAEFVTEKHHDNVNSLIAATQDEIIRQRLVFKSEKGPLVPAHVSATLLGQSGEESICLVATDLSELEASTEMLRQLRRQQEKLLESESRFKSLFEQTEQRVRERTAELEARVGQLARLTSELTLAEQRERQRLAQVLHDGLQQLLVAAKYRLTSLETAANEPARREIQEIEEILSDSIETSRSLTAELSPQVLKSGLAPALEWLARWMEEKHGMFVDLNASVDLAPLAENVVVLLFQAVRELLLNVVKHSQIKTARVEAGRREDRVIVSVEDHGRGFDPAQLNKKENQTRGLGLFALRERLELLGGALEMKSSPGQGCRLTIRIPIAPLAHAVETAPPRAVVSVGYASDPNAETPPEKSDQYRVALVDDHAVVRQGLATLLRQYEEFQVVGEASDGRSGVDLVRRLQPDVVLMDVSMPGMDGVEATRIVHEEFPDLCVIGLSMHDDAYMGEQMRRAGASAHLSKSGPADVIVHTIKTCLSGRAIRDPS